MQAALTCAFGHMDAGRSMAHTRMEGREIVSANVCGRMGVS